MHYIVSIGPLRNGTAGTFTDECFTTQEVAAAFGVAALNKIAIGRNRLGNFEIEKQYDAPDHKVLCFNSVATWQAKVRECHSIGCRVRVRLPKTHK